MQVANCLRRKGVRLDFLCGVALMVLPYRHGKANALL